MDEKQLFMAIDNCSDQFIEEVISYENSHEKSRHVSLLRIAAAVAVSILVIGTGVTALAMMSDEFHGWLLKTFTGYETTKISSTAPGADSGTDVAGDAKADICTDENDLLKLKGGLQIFRGDSESFICETAPADDDCITKVYRVCGNGLKQVEISRFEGEYGGTPFSFEYSVIAGEILGFNMSRSVNQVYPVMEGDAVYVELVQTKKDAVIKGCILRLNLKTKELQKITDDNVICNTVMIPGGGKILCNYRTERYWTALDLTTGKQTRLEGIGAYLHLNEISFIDKNTIFVQSDEMKEEKVKKGVTYLTPISCLVDLNTGKIKKKIIGDVGDFSPEWCYRIEGDAVEIYNIVTGLSFTPKEISLKNFHGVSAIGDYVLLWKWDEKTDDHYLAYIWNRLSKKGLALDIPEKLREEVEIYLAASEEKLLLSNGSEAYFVDISGIGLR